MTISAAIFSSVRTPSEVSIDSFEGDEISKTTLILCKSVRPASRVFAETERVDRNAMRINH